MTSYKVIAESTESLITCFHMLVPYGCKCFRCFYNIPLKFLENYALKALKIPI